MRDLMRSNTTLRRLYYRLKMLSGAYPQSESDEGKVLLDLADRPGVPKTFVEFGFHPMQFNCSTLYNRADWRGLLIDGNSAQVADARALFPASVEAEQKFLTLDNLDFIKSRFSKLGVLSIDVDGNDYWFLERLIDIEPAVISVEYNSSFGTRSITVPYDPGFNRHQKHPSGWYEGASITALSKLAARHGYGLAAVSGYGINLFFTKDGKLDPVSSWQTDSLRNRWSNTTSEQQWDVIKHLPYQEV